jgi:ABC-type lipoprotein release transport system permease subunit
MSMILLVAWRNVWRNTRRSALTIATVALGLALLLISVGLGDGGHYQMVESAVRMGSGDIVIQRAGYQRTGNAATMLTPGDLQRAEQWIRSIGPRFPVAEVIPRAFASCLASSAEDAAGTLVIGIDPTAEVGAAGFSKKLVSGGFPPSADSDFAVLGAGLARKLDLAVGDKFVLTGQAVHSSEMSSILTRVGGIMHTGLVNIDESSILLPLHTLQKFLNMDHGIHQLAVLLQDSGEAQALADLGKQALGDAEVLSWAEALPELHDFIRVDDAGNYLFNLVVFVLIGFLVVNTLLMSVLERNREFALLDALGMSPAMRWRMITVEALIIAAISCAAGTAAGLAGHAFFASHGLPMDLFYSGEVSAAGISFEPVIYSRLSGARIFGSASLVFGLTVVLALVPARRAAQVPKPQLLG